MPGPMPTAIAESCASSTPHCSQHHSIAGASVSACRGGLVSAVPPSSTRPSSPCSFASTTPTRRVAVSIPSSSISAPHRGRARRRARRGARAAAPARASRSRSTRASSSSSPSVEAHVDTVARAAPARSPRPTRRARPGSSSSSSKPRSCSSWMRSSRYTSTCATGTRAVVLLHDRERRARHGLVARRARGRRPSRTSSCPRRGRRSSTTRSPGRSMRAERGRRPTRVSSARRASSARSSSCTARARASRARSRRATRRAPCPPERNTADGCSVGISTRVVPGARERELLAAQLRDALPSSASSSFVAKLPSVTMTRGPDQLELAVEPRRARLDLVGLRDRGCPAAGTSRRSRCTRRRA